MAWSMAAVKAPASAIRTPLAEIPADVSESIEEAFAFCTQNPTQRLVIAFETEDALEENKALVRSYCDQRPAGRLTASIWSGFSGVVTDENGGIETDETGNPITKFSQTETETCKTPAMSLTLKVYVKRDKNANAATEPVAP